MSETRMQLFTDGGKHTTLLHCPFMNEVNKCGRVVGGFMVGSSSYGLICFIRSIDLLSFTIWNPATRESRYILKSQDLYNSRRRGVIRALVGFDIRPCGGYRVVVIVLSDGGEVKAEMHSRNSNSWKKICNDVSVSAMNLASPKVVTVNGCMYWQYESRNVACFDMWEEKYREIIAPCWEGKLAVINGSWLGFFFIGECCTCDIWVMNGQDQSWTKVVSAIPLSNSMRQLQSSEEMVTIMIDQYIHFYHNAANEFGCFPVISGHLEAVQYKEALSSVYNPV